MLGITQVAVAKSPGRGRCRTLSRELGRTLSREFAVQQGNRFVAIFSQPEFGGSLGLGLAEKPQFQVVDDFKHH
jgi:hypothetical protein